MRPFATMRLLVFALVFLGVAIRSQDADRTSDVRRAVEGGSARNVLLFLGDGMGDSEITAARNYEVGAGGRLALDSLPLTGAYTTYSVQEQNPLLPNYVPDSAATGTAWATGSKTSNGRISTTAGTDRDLKTILEIAQERGFRTGNVTTAEVTDATPAVLAAHVANRACQGPSDMTACPQDRRSAGGPGSIAEQLVAHRLDVLLGGGMSRFTQPTDAGPTVLDGAKAAGLHLVTTAAELEAATPTRPVLGLFAPENMALEWAGAEALPYPSNIKTPQICKEQNRPASEPSLAAMTAKALALLDRPAAAGPGFFLQVEGASIDKEDHAANPCAQIGETVAFDRAVKVGIDFARAHPRTLLIVTADHGHTAQIVPMPTDTDHPPGAISALTTKEGATMVMSYGTNLYRRSQRHTGTEVRIAAMGPQGANVLGVIDQTDVFRIFLRALDRTPAAKAAPVRGR